MSTSVLQTKYVFGYHTGVAQNAQFVSDTVVAYAAGYQIVLNDTQDGSQKFINSFVPGPGEQLDGFTCIALSPNRKLLAVAERGDKPEINIFDPSTRRKKKNLVHAEAISKCSILSMEFTHGNENLVVLSGNPDSTIVVFRWQKGKKLYDYKLFDNVPVSITNSDQFTRLSLNPLDSETTVVLGPQFLHFYRLTEDRVMPIPTSSEQLLTSKSIDANGEDVSLTADITCMCWIQDPPDGVVVANSQGKLALFESGEFKTFLAIALPAGVFVTSIICLSSGLVCGCSDGGIRFLKVKQAEWGEKLLPSGLFELTHEWFNHGFNNGSDSSGYLNQSHGAVGGGGGGAAGAAANGISTGNGRLISSTVSLASLDSTRHVAPSHAIRHMAISRDEDRLCCGYDHGQLYYVNIIGTPEGTKGEDMKPVATPNHNPGTLTGLDVCVRKPLAVTASLDRTVRVWNYDEGKLELTKSFSEDPLSVSFHPSGLHVAVGFGDKLRLLHLLMEDMRCFKELPVKACRECRFSRGGHYIAGTAGNNVILVFDFYTGEKLAELRGHSGRIRSLSWGPDDATLVSCGNDGALYCWDWEGGKRIGESVTKGVQYFTALTATASSAFNTASSDVSSVNPGGQGGQGGVGSQAAGGVAGSQAASTTGGAGGVAGSQPLAIQTANQTSAMNTTGGLGSPTSANGAGHETSRGIYTCSSEGVLRELDVPELQVVKTEDTGVPLSQIVLSSSETMLFAGTGGDGPGMVRAYSFPVSQEFVEFSCCARPISKMRLTFNDATLLVADDSGDLVVFDVKGEREKKSFGGGGGGGRRAVMPGGQLGAIPWCEDILITRSDYADRIGYLSELKASVEELLVQNDYQLRLREMTQAENIKEITEKFRQDLEAERNKYELLKEVKHDLAMEYEERLRQVEDVHMNELEELENNYQTAIMGEVDEYQKLILDRNTQNETWDDLRNTLIQTHKRRVTEMKEDFEQRLEEDRQLKEQLLIEKAESAREFKEMKTQLEDDVDTEIENIRDRYDQRLTTERELTLRFKGENGIMRKKFAVLAKTFSEQTEELEIAKDRELEIREMIRDKEDESRRLKKEIRGREEIINERDQKIYDLKKKNQELDKFKYVLDFKIKELKREIEPREAEIVALKDQIKAMDSELERYHKSNAAMDVLIGDLRTKLDGMQSVASNVRSLVHQSNSAVKVFKADVESCVQHVQDPEKLKEACALLLAKHGSSGPKAHDKDLESNVVVEYEKQRAFLEKTLAALTNKFANDVGAARAANSEVMRNNMTLIRDITAAREANKVTKATIQSRVISLRRMRMAQKQNKMSVGGGGSVSGGGSSSSSVGFLMTNDITASSEEAAAIEIAANRNRIAEMRSVVAALERKLELEKGPASRSGSRSGSRSRPGSRNEKLMPIMPAPIPIPTMNNTMEVPSTTSLDAPILL